MGAGNLKPAILFARRRRSPVASVAAWALMLSWLSASPASATAVQAFTLDQLVTDATVICVCRMVRQQSDWDMEKNMLVTNVAVEADETLKGEPGNELVVELFSGFGHEQLHIFAGAVFEQGERAFLFLKPAGGEAAPHYHLVGWAQGKFTIRANPKTGEEWVERDLRGIEFSHPDVAKALEALHTPDALRAAIRAAGGSDDAPSPAQ